MRTPVTFAAALILLFAGCVSPSSMERGLVRFQNSQDLSTLQQLHDERERFPLLGEAAKNCMDLGQDQQAEQLALELEKLLPENRSNPRYGEALHYDQIVLGRLALKHGNVAAAEAHLLAAGRTPGGPNLNWYGPNMSLAHDLLVAGDRQPVLQYLALCERFWSEDGLQRLEKWRTQVEQGKIPDFGANLTV